MRGQGEHSGKRREGKSFAGDGYPRRLNLTTHEQEESEEGKMGAPLHRSLGDMETEGDSVLLLWLSPGCNPPGGLIKCLSHLNSDWSPDHLASLAPGLSSLRWGRPGPCSQGGSPFLLQWKGQRAVILPFFPDIKAQGKNAHSEGLVQLLLYHFNPELWEVEWRSRKNTGHKLGTRTITHLKPQTLAHNMRTRSICPAGLWLRK